MINRVVPSWRCSKTTTLLTAAVDIWTQLDLACTRSCHTSQGRNRQPRNHVVPPGDSCAGSESIPI